MIERSESEIRKRDTRLTMLPRGEWESFETDMNQNLPQVKLFVVERTVYARGPARQRGYAIWFTDGWKAAAYRCDHTFGY